MDQLPPEKINYDYGFSFVDEEEFRRQEALLRDQLNQTQLLTKQKLVQMKQLIMPLLTNLMRDPDKDFIKWPNRTEKIGAFISQLDRFIDNS